MSTVQKKVLKKKVTTASPVSEPINNQNTTESADVVDNTAETVIPSSRVHNYVSGVKLNKQWDDLITQIKTDGYQSVAVSQEDLCDANKILDAASVTNAEVESLLSRINSGEDVSTVLSDDDKKKVGEVIKRMEDKNAKCENEADKVAINTKEISVNLLNKKKTTIDTALVDVISKKRSKFGKDSFAVLAAFSDMVVKEISSFALERLSEVGNSTLEPKYVFSSNIASGSLYGYYSTLKSYKKAQEEVRAEEEAKEAAKKAKKEAAKKAKKESADATADGTDAETTDVTQEDAVTEDVPHDESSGRGINFKFYVKSIVYDMKVSNEKYSNAKVSDRFQTLCSDIVLDILDDAVALSQIILNVMSTKTISAALFKVCLYSKVYDLDGYDAVREYLDSVTK